MTRSPLHDYLDEGQPLDESLIRTPPAVADHPEILGDQTWRLKWRAQAGKLRITLVDDPPVSPPGSMLAVHYDGYSYLGQVVRTFDDGTIGVEIDLKT